MQHTLSRTVGPVVPVTRPGGTNASPAFQSAYATLVRHGRHVLESTVQRWKHAIRYAPALIALTTFVMIVTTGYITGLPQLTVTGVCMLLSASIGVFWVYTYDDRIDDFLRSRILVPEGCVRASLRAYSSPGELPAGTLQFPYHAILNVVRPYAQANGFDSQDIDVCVTLLEDGFDGNIDDLLAIARNLRS